MEYTNPCKDQRRRRLGIIAGRLTWNTAGLSRTVHRACWEDVKFMGYPNSPIEQEDEIWLIHGMEMALVLHNDDGEECREVSRGISLR